MSKILVTGGCGFIGGYLSQYLADHQQEVTVIDNLSTGYWRHSPNKIKLIRGDVNNYQDISAVMLKTSFDYVFHYAAVVGVQRTLADPIGVLKDIEGIKNVLTLCKNTGVKRVFFSSSSEVYGESTDFPQNENTTPINSRLPYAVVKSVGETMIKAFHHEYGLDYTIFRFFNTYGYGQRRDFVVSKFIESAIRDEDITVYGDGLQTRTFLYVDDNVRITTDCLWNPWFVNDTINVGNPHEITIRELAETIIKLTGSSSKIEYLPSLKEGDMPRRKPDVCKLIRGTTNLAFTTLEEGLTKTIIETRK